MKLAGREIKEHNIERDVNIERYSALADEAEHAVIVLGDRLADAYTEPGERDAG
jgi:hypothetical protein